MKDWTKEVDEYEAKIKDMSAVDACNFLWREYYFEHRLSRRAHNWLVMWIDDYVAR